jgi:hypothetical protein
VTAVFETPKSIGGFLRAEPERFREWMLCRQGKALEGQASGRERVIGIKSEMSNQSSAR